MNLSFNITNFDFLFNNGRPVNNISDEAKEVIKMAWPLSTQKADRPLANERWDSLVKAKYLIQQAQRKVIKKIGNTTKKGIAYNSYKTKQNCALLEVTQKMKKIVDAEIQERDKDALAMVGDLKDLELDLPLKNPKYKEWFLEFSAMLTSRSPSFHHSGLLQQPFLALKNLMKQKKQLLLQLDKLSAKEKSLVQKAFLFFIAQKTAEKTTKKRRSALAL